MAEKAPGFVHLHNHTTYSLLDGAQKTGELCARAAEDGQTAISITDHGNLFGVMDFGKKAAKHGVKPIIGMEAYVAPGSRTQKSPQIVPGVGKKNYYHLILLAQNYTGYKNLIRLSTSGYLEGFYYRPRIDKELLREHSEGLICLSACLASEVATLLNHDQDAAARDAAGEFRDLFGKDRYWLELQDHGIPDQHKVNDGTVKLARELGVGLVATNDCHYLRADDHFAHDVLICIQTGKTVKHADRMTYTPQHYLKSRAEMAKLFNWMPEAIENSMAIADLCEFSFEKQPLHLPEFPVPEGYDDRRLLRARRPRGTRSADAGTAPRTGRPAAASRSRTIEERLDPCSEISIIREMGFAGYFLITWDFIRYARDNGIPVGPGRGSAAGSLVAYCLRITDIDPMQYDLLFERFLNPERVSMPDIDIDFCFRKRERGHRLRHGQVRPRERGPDHHLRDHGGPRGDPRRRPGAGHALRRGRQDRQAGAGRPGITLDHARSRRSATVAPLQRGYERRPPGQADARRRPTPGGTDASRVDPRRRGGHRPEADHRVRPALQGEQGSDEITTQYAMDEIEEIGLLKMDFLGLRTLTLIDDAVALIENRGSRSTSTSTAGRSRDLRAVLQAGAHGRRLPVRIRGCGTSCAGSSPSASRT